DERQRADRTLRLLVDGGAVRRLLLLSRPRGWPRPSPWTSTAPTSASGSRPHKPSLPATPAPSRKRVSARACRSTCSSPRAGTLGGLPVTAPAMTRRWLGDENPVASLGELKLLLLGVRGAVPLALESGTELGEGREVLGAVGGGLAA